MKIKNIVKEIKSRDEEGRREMPRPKREDPPTPPTVEFILDHRFLQEYNDFIKLNGKVEFAGDRGEKIKETVIRAINDRGSINELIVTNHPFNSYTHRVDIEMSDDLYNVISGEASKNKLSTEDYLKAIAYTYYHNLNEVRRAEKKAHEEALKRRTPSRLEIVVPIEIIEALDKKYGKPKNEGMFNSAAREHSSMILKVLKDYFHLEDEGVK